MAWDTSNRASRLPPNWATTRARILARDRHTCQATHHHPKCDGVGAEVDHITPGDNHTDGNLQALSTACHKAKTARDNTRRRQAMARDLRRPTEPHPGRT